MRTTKCTVGSITHHTANIHINAGSGSLTNLYTVGTHRMTVVEFGINSLGHHTANTQCRSSSKRYIGIDKQI